MTSLNRRRAVLLLVGAAASAAAAEVLRPTHPLAAKLGPIRLERLIPKSFGSWQLDIHTPATVVNPELSAKLSQLYSEILTRTYVDTESSYRIMLSIAYGADQREGHGLLHDPAVCYPAQGFSIERRHTALVNTPQRIIRVRQLETRLGTSRPEPVTYWMTIGEHVFLTGTSRKLIQIRYALQGLIPDGLVFRVSSIDRDSKQAFAQQNRFIKDIVAAIPTQSLTRLVGPR